MFIYLFIYFIWRAFHFLKQPCYFKNISGSGFSLFKTRSCGAWNTADQQYIEYIPNQWIVFFACSDWLLKLRIAFAFDLTALFWILHTSFSSFLKKKLANILVLAIPGLLYTKTIIVIIITQKRKEKERKRDPTKEYHFLKSWQIWASG